METIELYDKKDPISIEKYAQKLIGHTFTEVGSWNLPSILREEGFSYNSKARKGGLGNFIEEQFFCYKANSDSEADFNEAGVELKVTPYEITKNNKLSAGERLVLTMINYSVAIEPDFKKSHLWDKCKLMLLIYYLRDKSLKNNMDYRIDYAKLFTPPERDLQIIIHDYEIINEKIKDGKADELSEADTLFLGACTKGENAKKSLVPQAFYAPGVKARKRAFCLKSSYMTYVLNQYIASGKDTYEPIVKNQTGASFEQYVKQQIDSYRGLSINALCKEFQVSFQNKPKNLESMLAYRMLGIKGNRAEEFVKANIVVKTIRIGKNGKIKESMSFPTFKFKELVKETWETSTFGNYLRETRFFFIVYRYNSNDDLILLGSQFWNVPNVDLEGNIREVWEETKKVLANGLEIEKSNGHTTNNFPKASKNPVCHVRPHARNASDTYELPDGRQYPKQCFWLNSSYILSQIDNELKEDI